MTFEQAAILTEYLILIMAGLGLAAVGQNFYYRIRDWVVDNF